MQLAKKNRISAQNAQQRPVGRQWHEKVRAAVGSDRARFAALAVLVLLTVSAGGSSRSDIPALIVLRPAAILLLVYALCFAAAQQLREVVVPLLTVVALMMLALLQLVPLPPAIWTSFPQGEAISALSALVGMDGAWRPLSLDPNRTWNTFFALFVPLAAICLVAIQGSRYRSRVFSLLIAVAALSAVLGFLQTIGGNGLHFYRITHSGYPVGLFANKNHQSIMLLWLMLSCAWLAAQADPRRRSPVAIIGGVLASILVIFPLLVLTGSRAGLLLSVPALVLSAWLLFRAPAMEALRRRAAGWQTFVVGTIVAAMALPLLFVFGVLAMSSRKTALSRLFELDATDDRRWFSLPAILDMARDFLSFGSGFGSFQNVFNIYEPTESLTVRYVNQAHNDVVQLVTEGGPPAVLILIVALIWFLRSCWRIGRSGQPAGSGDAMFFAGSLLVWLAASVVDYPLRTPIGAMLLAALTAQLSMLSTRLRFGSDEPAVSGAR